MSAETRPRAALTVKETARPSNDRRRPDRQRANPWRDSYPGHRDRPALLAVVPARGGSVGVPRKALRPVADIPLILRTLRSLQRVPEITRIVVSTEDPTIGSFCRLRGFDVIDRPPGLSLPDVPVARVAVHACEHENWSGPVGVFQPTAPTLRPETISAAIREFHAGGWASLTTVVEDAHLLWDEHGPLFEQRVNRQQAEPLYRETGGAHLARACPVWDLDPLVGHPHCRYPVPPDEAVDIDTPDDLEHARRILGRKRVHFVVTAGHVTGMGHTYRCLALADELVGHECTFSFAPEGSVDAWALVAERGYSLTPERLDAQPDLVVFDRLDVEPETVARVKADGVPVVSLEDLGPGSDLADLVVNELYDDLRPYVLTGPKYAVLRPEFLCAPRFGVREDADRVLVTFGGTDPARLAERVGIVAAREAKVCEVGGRSMAEAMLASDLVVCSAGRTVHEAAALGVPTVSIAANERESRHSHCAGVLRLGLHATVSNDQVQEAVRRVLGSVGLRREMSVTARREVDGRGARRIVHRIQGLLEGL